MITFLEIIFYIYVTLCTVAVVAYLPRIYFFVYAFKKQPKTVNEKKNTFAIIIPARDESLIIKLCLDSLMEQNYPKEFYDIHVVVADPDDPTVSIAGEYENVCVHKVENQNCKGDALDGSIKNILRGQKKYDGFIVMDADCVADKEYLAEMNNAMGLDRHIVCGKKGIKNWQSQDRASRSLFSNCSALTYTLKDDMGNKFRTVHKMPVSMSGSNLMIRADVIEKLEGWPYKKTLSDDNELTMDSVLKDFSTMYCEYATVYTEEVTGFKASIKRRLRWMRGILQCRKMYGKEIKKKTFQKKDIKWKNFEILYGAVPVLLFIAASIVMSVVGFFASFTAMAYGPGMWILVLFKYMFLPVLIIYVILFLYTCLAVGILGKEMKVPFIEKVAVIFFNPFFLAMWFPIAVFAFFTRKKNTWEKVARIPFNGQKENS